MNLPRAMWNGDVYPKDPNAINVGFHDGLMSWMIPGGGPLKAAKWSTTITRAVGAAPKGFSKFKSINQLNKLAQTGKLPKSITRFDKGKILGELDHVHFNTGAALNINGTWKHGSKILTNKEIKILTQNGWTLPR